MKKNRYIFIVVIILAVIAAVLVMSRTDGTFKKQLKDFAVDDTSTVTKIFLADKNNNTILLEKITTGEWMLNSKYKARKSGVDMLLETMLKIMPRAPVPKSGHNNVIAQLAARSVKVEVYQEVYRINLFNRIHLFPHEKLTKTYYVGGATPDNMGTFMLMEGSSVPFIVHILRFRGFVSTRYSTQERNWRDHTVFKKRLAEIQSVIMEIPGEPENSYKINKNNKILTLINLTTDEIVPDFDTLKILNFLTSFTDIRYEALLNDIDPHRKDSIINSTPKHILTVVDIKGDSTMITTFFKPNDAKKYDIEGKLYVHDLDRLYALINEDRDFVLIQYFVFDKVLRPLSYFNKS